MTEESREKKEDQETGKPFDRLRAGRGNGEGGKDEAAADSDTAESPAVDGTAEPKGETEPAHPYEELLEEYPLRDAAEDPVWSVRIVKWWMWFLAFCFAGLLLLLALGFFYD